MKNYFCTGAGLTSSCSAKDIRCRRGKARKPKSVFNITLDKRVTLHRGMNTTLAQVALREPFKCFFSTQSADINLPLNKLTNIVTL